MIMECGAFTMEQGGKAQRETSPPPPPAAAKCLAPWLCCAYDMPATCVQRMGGEKGAPPPQPPPPPRGRMREGRGRKEPPPPPPPRTTRQGGEAEEGECGTSHTTVPVEGAIRASPGGGTTGGAGVGWKGRRRELRG